MGSLLYGQSSAERVVAAHQISDQAIRIFKRIEGKILYEDVEFFPFFFLADSSLLQGFPKRHWLKELAGTNYYKFIAAFSRWSEMWEAVQYALREYNKSRFPKVSTWQDLSELLVRPDASRQFLAQSGITLFKGMTFEELERVQIVIQRRTDHGKLHAKKRMPQLEIDTIALAATDAKVHFFDFTHKNKNEIFQQFIDCLQELDPDVIEGYDLFGDIIPALIRLSEDCSIPLTIGRGQSELRYPHNRIAEDYTEIDWLNVHALGRHFIDLRTLSENHLMNFTLEKQIHLPALLKMLGIDIPVCTDPSKTPPQKKEIRQHVHLLQTLSASLSPKLFYLTQWCPFNYHMMNHLSITTQVESLLFREYIRQKHSIPKPYDHFALAPFPSETFYTGVYSGILHTTLQILPARIVVQEQIAPRTDYINAFGSLMHELLDLFIHAGPVRGFQDALSILLEGFPTYLSYARGLFNDPQRAEQLLLLHSSALNQALSRFELYNVKLLHYDHDGFFIQLPDNVIGAVNVDKFLERISANLPYGTKFIQRRFYANLLTYNRRNFVLSDGQRLILRGTAFQHRGMERFLQSFVQHLIESLMATNITDIHQRYLAVHAQILHHQWSPMDFCRVETVKESLDVYQQAVTTGNRSKSPAFEAAIRAHHYVKAGDKVLYYLAEYESETDPLLTSKLASEWDPLSPDEHTALYLKRLQETVEKFSIYFEPQMFERLFSPDELFPFSPEGIRIIERPLGSEIPSSKGDSDDYSIWLADK